MTIRELLRYLEHGQKIIIRESKFKELFSGTTRQVSLSQFGDKEVIYLIVDNDPYTADYLKIEVKRCAQHLS